MENEEMINDEQELNDVEVIDADEVCEQEDSEVSGSGLDGLSFALGTIATLVVLKGIKKVVKSEAVQSKIVDVKAKFAERKERRAEAKAAKKLKVVDAESVNTEESKETDKKENDNQRGLRLSLDGSYL